MRSSSSRFQKDLFSTQAFEYDSQLGQANFSLAQSFDEFDLQQSCLLRLKAQREKIEQLTNMYQQKDKQLMRRSEKEKVIIAEMEHLSEMAAYKSEWQTLKKDYDTLFKRNQVTQAELSALKRQLHGVASINCDETEQLKKEIKYLKEQRLLLDAHWEAILRDKEQHLKKDGRAAQQREYELRQQIESLRAKMESLEEFVSQNQLQFERKGEQLRQELTIRQQDLRAFQKIVESYKKHNNQYKAKLISMQQAWQKDKNVLIESMEQLKAQVKMLRKDHNDKENAIYQFKEIIKKCDNKNQALEQTVHSLKTNLKKFKADSDSSIKKMSSTSEQERAKLQLFIHELKRELQGQMQQKVTLWAEVKRLKGQLQRKQQQEKQRKLLLMTEFREIDKMQRIVKKVM